MARTVYYCPVHGCKWQKSFWPGQIPGIGSWPDSFSVDELAIKHARRENQEMERVLEEHMDTHTTLEWAVTVSRMAQKIYTLERKLEERST